LLRVSEVNLSIEGVHILKGVSFGVSAGEAATLIGSNGAGKSSMLNTIMGVYKPAQGNILFKDEEIVGSSPEEVVSKGISIVPEGRRIFSNLTVSENLMIGAVNRWVRSSMKADMDGIMELFPALNLRRKQLGGSLSGGEQQMLAIARGLMAHPELLLLDEPSMGLAPIMCKTIFSILKKIHEQGTTILLVEQNANLAMEFASKGHVMVVGRILKSGSRKELLEDDFVRKAYLGLQE
jgi:branched-chain amino acid transport system ATP-binding protein